MNTNTCPNCHAAIPADAPGGICPSCALLSLLGLLLHPYVPEGVSGLDIAAS